MRVIVFEGLDKSGKHTMSELLKEYLESKGHSVVKSEFHRYDTPTGDLIMKWLKKEWDVDQHTIELIMTADKQAQQKWFDELEETGTEFLILDRYTGSQQTYSKANGISQVWTAYLQKYMRKPDVEVFVDITAEESMKRKGKHNNGENDRYESDLDMLERVRKNYKERDNIMINGMQPKEKVFEDILAALKHLL